MKLRLFGAAFAALVTFNSANATVYNINEVINVASSVVGTLTTDGFIGSLTDPTHIVDWNLTVTANTVSGNLFGPSSGNNSTVTSLLGPALVASATDLTFNFVSLTASEFRIESSNVSWLFEAYANPIFGQEFVTIDTIDFGTLGGTREFQRFVGDWCSNGNISNTASGRASALRWWPRRIGSARLAQEAEADRLISLFVANQPSGESSGLFC